ncbi:MAG: PAS domain S-box protein [Smithellaceae bacterium]
MNEDKAQKQPINDLFILRQEIKKLRKSEIEQKETIKTLKISEEFFRSVTQHATDIIIIVTKTGKLTYVSPSIEYFLGYKPEKLIGKSAFDYVVKEDLPRAIYDFGRAILTNNIVVPNSFGVKHKDGSIRILEGVGKNLFGNPSVRGFVMNVRDITERRETEKELTLYRKHLEDLVNERTSELANINAQLRIQLAERKLAEEALRQSEEHLQRAEKMEAIGTLAGGVAHDLNNVLGVLVGYSELLAEKLAKDNPLRRYADNILQSSIKGSVIINDLLTLARRGVTISEVANLNKAISDYLQTPEFEKMKSYHPDVKICTELEDGLLNIKGSPVHLGKTIMNLVSNAAEAISGHGKVTIRTANVHLDRPISGYDTIQKGDYAVLVVSDTGKGISTNDLDKIFEPFYTKKVMGRSGTGLGLAVVWWTVKDHHGYINVQSEEGKGTTFSLYFPLTGEEPAKGEKAVAPVSYMGRGESILVVDDVKDQRELAMSMMKRLGYRVEAVAGGEESIEYIRDKKVDLMVLDMIMDPGIDGMETYRRILEINPRQKAILVSGFSENDRVRKALEMGAGFFVQKPYILEKIGLAVRKELDRK